MKQYISLMAGALMAAGLTSCVDTEKPVFQTPTTFTINTPGLQDQLLQTTGDMDSKETFMLYCSQPDYGFATKCAYTAQVSLSGEFTDEEVNENGDVTKPASYVTISNQEGSSAAMRFKTYDLAVAMCQLLGITNPKDKDWDAEQAWADYIANGGATEMKVFFKATCEITGVADSFIASSNTVSYNKVGLSFANPKPGVIYPVGDMTCWTVANDPNSGVVKGNAFMEPRSANKDFYEDYKLIEPEIGCKLYAGNYWMPATDDIRPENKDKGNDYTTQFRFFTELVGWDHPASEIASNVANFYVESINDKFSDGFNDGSIAKLNAVYGDGSWGFFLDKTYAMTFVVSLEDSSKPVVWVKVGTWNVTVGLDDKGIKEPVFDAPAAE